MIEPAKPVRGAFPTAQGRAEPSARWGRWATQHALVLDLAAGLGLFIVSLTVYNATLTPSLSYLSPDGNELATIPYVLGLAHSTGYPLYTWIGKLFTFLPIGDVAHRINLMSAVMGAGGVAMLYGILVLTLAGQPPLPQGKRERFWVRVVAAAVALVFAFSPSFWAQTSIAEVYAPNLLMVALQVLLVLQWARVEGAQPAGQGRAPTTRSLAWFAAFCLAFALSTGTHISNLGFGLGYAAFTLAVNWRFALKPRALAVGVGAFALGMLQHLWLPYKAGEVFDPLMARQAPNTWVGFYNYTLGAFPQMKFAFPWPQVPDRIVIYLDLVRQQFSLVGLVLGVAGMYVLLFQQPQRWWLFMLMYLVHVVFFTQYRVFDLDVFFIPAHFLFAIWIAVGAWWLISRIVTWIAQGREGGSRMPVAPALTLPLAALLVMVPAGLQLRAHWESSDHSHDTAINDFYRNVWEMLPENSILLGKGGVFGYDAFYWRLVYGVRPDVLMPMLPGSQPDAGAMAAERPIYSTSRGGGPGRRSPWDMPQGMVADDAWYVPVLIGGSTQSAQVLMQQELVLYAVGETPPALIIPLQEAHPQQAVNQVLDGLTLLGYDLDSSRAQPGGRIHLTLYWLRGEAAGRANWISTALGEHLLETHSLGLGNLERYLTEVGAQPGGVIVEDYWIVIPATLSGGDWPLVVSTGNASLTLTQVAVPE